MTTVCKATGKNEEQMEAHSERLLKCNGTDAVGDDTHFRRTRQETKRVLVGIASYGTANIRRLERIVTLYNAMRFAVDVVVFSEAPKQLSVPAKLIVGLPSENPWSLPFAHKPYFAERAEEYDLFVYSEDDIEVSEASLDAFMELSEALSDDEIGGFIRYEVSESGEITLPDFRDGFHWVPTSVQKRGKFTIAQFSNEHSALYVLNRRQLKTAIGSGNFLRPPYAGKYDMLCSAATDPYTSCGMKKVIAVSHLNSFLIYHSSNRYAGRIGMPWHLLETQVEAMLKIVRNEHPSTMLVLPSKDSDGKESTKNYYEAPEDSVLKLVAKSTHRSILSIGCGWGYAEAILQERGMTVTALPLDSIIGAVAKYRGIEVILSSLEDGLQQLRGRQFDCIYLSNVLHLVSGRSSFYKRCAELVRSGGCIVVDGGNSHYLPNHWRRRRGHIASAGAGSGAVDELAAGVDAMFRSFYQYGFIIERIVWHGYRHEGVVSGAIPGMRAKKMVIHNSWRMLRRLGEKWDGLVVRAFDNSWPASLGSSLASGRWLATGMAARLVRER